MKCLIVSFSLFVFGVHLAHAYQDPTSRQVEVFVNVYDHPKTGFSCQGKNPGEYYADPATKCAVYYVCIPNPTGTLSPQSFACPNGTIFSQATRVCRPHEEVFCPLSSRFYDSVHGDINTKYEAAPLPVMPLAPEPVVPARRQSHPVPAPKPRQSAPPAAPTPAPAPAPAKPAAQSNPFNRGYRNRGALNQPVSTTSTTTPPPPPQPAPGPADYEYDYADYNETSLNAASSVHSPVQTMPLAKASSEPKAVVAEVANQNSKKEHETTVAARRKRDSNSMLSRRKGQLSDEPVKAVTVESESELDELSAGSAASSNLFTCQDKITGVAYADVASQCKYFYVCVSVAKGKLWPYRLECDPGKRFNQILGMCDQNTLDRTCANSHHYYIYNKLYKPSKKHLLELASKSQAQ